MQETRNEKREKATARRLKAAAMVQTENYRASSNMSIGF